MTHFWVRGGEGFLAALAVGGKAKVFFRFFGERQHVDLLAEYIAYNLAFTHYVVVELRRGVRAAVYEWWSLVLRVLCHSVHAEAGHLVVADNFCIAFSVDLCRWRERFKV